MTVIDDVARKIAETDGFVFDSCSHRPWTVGDKTSKAAYRKKARAALIALRDGVTPGMITAVEETGVGVYNDRIIAYWTGMIDHVLQEGEKVTDVG